MRKSIILTLALLSAGVAQAAERCERLPFPLPSAKVSAEWGDQEFEQWADERWEAFCEPKHKSAKLAAMLRKTHAKACECRPR